MRRTGCLAILAAVVLAAVGCGRKQASLPPPLPPVVEVGRPIKRMVTEYEYFTGRTEASETVDIRSRVTGYLKKAPLAKFEAKNGEVKEGDDVPKGRPLFEIDPSTYEAEVERNEANIKQYQALLERLDADLRRGRTMLASRAISREELDKIAGDRAQADANLKAARASANVAKINLGYTKIAAPITGRLSRRHVDPGNLVKADDTILTTIVQLDPIHAYFDIDERTVIRFRKMLQAGEITSAREKALKVSLALGDEEKFLREGTIDFIDNRLDPGTGTLRIRVTTSNKQPEAGSKQKEANRFLVLSPGMFIRLRLPVGNPRRELLVPESALASKQGEKVVYVKRTEEVEDEDGNKKTVTRVEEVPVEVGQLEADNYRVIRKGKKAKRGLTTDDEVVITGLQRVRDGQEIRLGDKDKKKPPGQTASR